MLGCRSSEPSALLCHGSSQRSRLQRLPSKLPHVFGALERILPASAARHSGCRTGNPGFCFPPAHKMCSVNDARTAGRAVVSLRPMPRDGARMHSSFCSKLHDVNVSFLSPLLFFPAFIRKRKTNLWISRKFLEGSDFLAFSWNLCSLQILNPTG